MKAQTEIPRFSVVEIEVNSLCNRKCSYCPVSILPLPNTPQYMEIQLFHKIINELAEINYKGMISYHFYNEPLLRKDLDNLIAITKNKIPKAFQLLYTNGDLLTDDRYYELISSGLDYFFITQHDNKNYKNREKQFVQFSKDLILTNRGGIMSNLNVKSLPINKPCFSPNDNLIITSSGKVVLCSEDAQRVEIIGNLKNEKISEIWFSEKYINIRNLLNNGNRKLASKICRKCNNSEYSIANNNYHNHIVTSIRKLVRN